MSARAWRGRRTGQWSNALKQAKRRAKQERALQRAGIARTDQNTKGTR